MAGKLFLNQLQNIDLGTLDDEDKSTLIDFCHSTLEALEGEGEEDKEESKEETKSEAEESKEDKAGQVDWQGNGGQPTFVFNLGASEKWPQAGGTSIREREIARRKEQTDE